MKIYPTLPWFLLTSAYLYISPSAPNFCSSCLPITHRPLPDPQPHTLLRRALSSLIGLRFWGRDTFFSFFPPPQRGLTSLFLFIFPPATKQLPPARGTHPTMSVPTYAGMSGRYLSISISTVATTGFLLFGYDRMLNSPILVRSGSSDKLTCLSQRVLCPASSVPNPSTMFSRRRGTTARCRHL